MECWSNGVAGPSAQHSSTPSLQHSALWRLQCQPIVILPQLGESVAEGLITRWLKKPGDTVALDEPLVEITTDKVNVELPAPAAGVIKELRAKEGETVPVEHVIAVIDETGEADHGTKGTSATEDVEGRKPAGKPAPTTNGAAPIAEADRHHFRRLVEAHCQGARPGP